MSDDNQDDKRQWEAAAEAVNDLPSARPTIEIVAGERPAMVDSAEQILVRHAEKLKVFQRGGDIVRIIKLSAEDVARVKKREGRDLPEGALVLHPLTATALLEIFDRYIRWVAIKGKGKKRIERVKDCPAQVAAAYLSRVGSWKVPALLGVIEAPILRPDGTILDTAGYDRATGLFFDRSGDWPTIPSNPSRVDAEDALRQLLEPFAEFPFIGEEDKSVFVAAILTALQRRLLESAPLCGFTAPQQRSGKSLLADAVAIIATGRPPAAAPAPRESEELRKAVTSFLKEGHLIVQLDNIDHPLDSPDLARAITQSPYADRQLGGNTILRLPTNVMWVATGNNLTFKGDLSSRTLLCRIDARLERPEERTFRIANLRGHLQENRKQLAVAGFTMLRAYQVAGCPRQKVLPWGGFDDWSREIRESLLWLGLADPCVSRKQISVNDPERELTADIFRCWIEVFGDSAKLVHEVVAAVSEPPEPQKYAELRRALLMVSAQRDDASQIDPRRLGRWLAGVEGRIVDDMRLVRDHKLHQAMTWRVSRGELGSSGSFTPVDPSEKNVKNGESPCLRERNQRRNAAERHQNSAQVPVSLGEINAEAKFALDRPVSDSPHSPNSPNSGMTRTNDARPERTEHTKRRGSW